MNQPFKRAFFEDLSGRWDGFQDLPTLARRLRQGIEAFGVAPSERVLDLGAGTGNLTLALLGWLAPDGRVIAVDFSRAMLTQAGRKTTDSRFSMVCADAGRLPFLNGSVDRVICFSAWPHFSEFTGVAQDLYGILRRGGCLHIWHLIPREKVNAIHGSSGRAVANDVLVPAQELGTLLIACGFEILDMKDDSRVYLVSARRP